MVDAVDIVQMLVRAPHVLGMLVLVMYLSNILFSLLCLC